MLARNDATGNAAGTPTALGVFGTGNRRLNIGIAIVMAMSEPVGRKPNYRPCSRRATYLGTCKARSDHRCSRSGI
jgi:hypothetical protein